MVSEQFIMSVSGPRMTGRLSLLTLMLTLSAPGDLFVGMDKMIRLTPLQITGCKLNKSSMLLAVAGKGDVAGNVGVNCCS